MIFIILCKIKCRHKVKECNNIDESIRTGTCIKCFILAHRVRFLVPRHSKDTLYNSKKKKTKSTIKNITDEQ